MKLFPLKFMLLTLLLIPVPGWTAVVINEILASNTAGLTDGFGEQEDWIELYNEGPTDVDLDGYFLTDASDFLTQWRFPAVSIPAGGYRVVMASGRDVTDASGYVHTGFQLNRGGDYLALVQPDGTTLEDELTPTYPEQFTDISYGIPAGGGARVFFDSPSPGSANGTGYPGVVKDTTFSVDRGLYDTPFVVAITSTTAGVTLRYTLDGSMPTETTGILYTTPLTISSTTVLRALAYRSGWLSTDVDTHTYLFVDDVAQQPADPPGWPTDWGYESNVGTVVPSDYEMDPRVVTNTLPGYTARDALRDLPSVAISMLLEDFATDHDSNGIYSNSADRWERPCSMEYILPDGSQGFQLNAKIEAHGNSSRNPSRMQKHSLRVTFTSEYGPPKLEYPLFAGSAVERFNQLVLRACFTDSWGLASWSSTRYRPNDSMYIRDVWMKNSLRDMGQPSSYGDFVHLYVNGLYFGVHNLTERLAPDFFADHLGGTPEDWDINEDFSTPRTRWNTMLSIDPSTLAGYTQIQDYLDVENLADYFLLHFYGDAEDWPSHNGYAAANAVSGDGRYRFFVWDQEIALDYHGRAAARIDNNTGAGQVFQKMRASEEFRLLFADRVYQHLFHEGALSIPGSTQRWLALTDRLDKAIVAESARWGDTQQNTPYGSTAVAPGDPSNADDLNYPAPPHPPDYYFTREDSWIIERDNVVTNYIPAIHDLSNSYALINVLRAENLYPDIDPPEFSQHGGEVSASFGLTLSSPVGTIYYTLDGSDPRLPGGALNPAAQVYAGNPIFFTANPTQVKARTLSGSEWSALHEAGFHVDTEVARSGNLVVSEIHYNPKGSDDTEFIEVQNVGSVRVALGGVQLDGAVDFTFEEALLEPGAYAVAVRDQAAFSNRYLNVASAYYYRPIQVAGSWTRALANDGETLLLRDRNAAIIQEIPYQDGGAWPGRADGRGSSLVRDRPEIPPAYPEHWRASCRFHGSPGRADSTSPVVINELMSHSDSGQDWIELLNTGTNTVDISNWFLSDDLENPLKYPIPSTPPLAAGEFHVLTESGFGSGVDGFVFSELGEEAVLVEASGSNVLRVISYEDFGAAAQDVSFGRHLRSDGSDRFTALQSATAAAANAYPKVGPIILGEIMYHPGGGRPEYVELINLSANDVPLYDPAHPANTWKLTSAAAYSFPQGTFIPGCGRILIAETDAATFRSVYTVPAGVTVYGPWIGKLDNDAESVRLRRPGSPETDGTVPFIVVDRVDYRDVAPWLPEADGSGASLERLDYTAFGDDAANWYAALSSSGTPGDGPDPCNYTPNQYPELTDPGTLDAAEGSPLVFQLQATDPDAGQLLEFTRGANAPPGSSLSASGLLSWIPGEDDGPGNVEMEVRVTDNGIPNLSDTLTLSVAVAEVNAAPDLLRGTTTVHTNLVELLPFGADWRYLDDGSDQGSNWFAQVFNDNVWAEGPAPLGYGDSHIATTVSYGSNSQSKYRTTYFRHSFTVTNIAAISSLTAYLVRDDAAMIYLNGTEVARDNMPAGVIDYLTFAADGIGGADETTPQVHLLDPADLVAGTNSVAVEVHQASTGSSDIGMDLRLEATYILDGPKGLVDRTVWAGEEIRFVARSIDPDRPAQGVTYQLAPGAPAEAAIDPLSGTFTWSPTEAEGPALVGITLIATDDGLPPLSDQESFTVTVLSPLKSGDIVINGGVVTWAAIPGDSYRIEYCDDLSLQEWNPLETRSATTTLESVVDPDYPASGGLRCYRILWMHE